MLEAYENFPFFTYFVYFVYFLLSIVIIVQTENGCAFASPYEILHDAQCENHCFSTHLPNITMAT